MANISAIKLPNGTTYTLKDNGALQLTGGQVTGPVTFGDSISVDEATIGDLVINGNASFTNNIQANTINGVAVGNSPKFTDTNTTYTFANGTNGFTVTPSGGTAQTVTVTPSIANNLTGTKTTATLSTTWSSNQQTVTVSGVTSSNYIVVSPAPASYEAYCEAGIYCSAQGSNSLTFNCDTVPSTALTVNIMIVN